MDYRPEIDPALSKAFEPVKERLLRTHIGLNELKAARRNMPEDNPVVVTKAVAENTVEVQLPEQRTASEMLAELREQIQKEAA